MRAVRPGLGAASGECSATSGPRGLLARRRTGVNLRPGKMGVRGLGGVGERTGHSVSSLPAAGVKNSVSSLGPGWPGTSVAGDDLRAEAGTARHGVALSGDTWLCAPRSVAAGVRARPRVCAGLRARPFYTGERAWAPRSQPLRAPGAPRAPGLSAATWVATLTLQRPDTAAGRHGQRPAPGASPATPSSAAGLSPPASPPR